MVDGSQKMAGNRQGIRDAGSVVYTSCWLILKEQICVLRYERRKIRIKFSLQHATRDNLRAWC